MRLLRRILPFAILLAILVALWASGLVSQLNWTNLSRHHAELAAWIARNPVTAPAAFAVFYAVTAAIALPEGALLTIAGGVLFGTLMGGAMAILGATLGAVVLFLAARSAFAAALAARAGPRLARMRAELHRNGFLYLLAMRLIPAFPFWLVNLAAALSGMRLLPFAAATFLGIIPATFLYAWVGASAAGLLATGTPPNLAMFLSPQVLVPLVVLGLLALLPVAWQMWKRSDA